MFKSVEQKKQEEIKLVTFMIDIYIKHHKDKQDEYSHLYDYTKQRINHCPFIATKTFCSACKIHCYNKKNQELIKEVMRYSGKWMIIYHPIITLKHIIVTIKRKINV